MRLKTCGDTCCNDSIVAALRCMSQHVCEVVQDSLAKLHRILTASACREILDYVVPEVRLKYETVVSAMTHKQIVARSACQRIAAP